MLMIMMHGGLKPNSKSKSSESGVVCRGDEDLVVAISVRIYRF